MIPAEKVVVITGASRGLGYGVAQAFLSKGLRVGACARTRPDLGAGQCVTAAVDVTNLSTLQVFTESVVQQFGRIDLWINNAGVLDPIGSARSVDSAAFENNLRVNVVGVLNGSRCFAEHWRSQGPVSTNERGVLINVSSGAGRSAYEGWSAYCASKAAVDRLTEVIALEEQEVLRAHAVAPGVIDTGMQEQIRAQTEEDFPLVERFREMKQENAFSTPEEVAEGFLRIAFDAGPLEVLLDLRD